MKIFSTLILSFFAFPYFIQTSISAQIATEPEFLQTLFLLEDNGKYGLMDEEGEIWLETKFDVVLFLEEGQASSKGSYLNYIKDRTYSDKREDENFLNFFAPSTTIQNLLCLPKKRYSTDVTAHFFPYEAGKILVKEGRKCYYLDENAQPLLEEFYEDATLFEDGIAAVKKNDKVGVIDSIGNFTIPPIHQDVWIRKQGSISIKEEVNGLLEINHYNKYGKTIENNHPIWFLNSHIRRFKNEQGKIGIIDTSTQKIIVPPIYKQAISSQKGTALVLEDKKWTLIDTTGKKLIGKTYSKVAKFQEGFAPIRQSILWTFVSSKGKILGKPRFSKVFDDGFHNGLAKVELGFKQYLIDTTGKTLFGYNQIEDAEHPRKWYERTYIRVKKEGLWGAIHRDSLKEIIPPKYAAISPLPDYSCHLFKLPNNPKLWGIMDLHGKEIKAPQFEDIRPTVNPKLFLIKKTGKWGIADTTGKTILLPMYEDIRQPENALYYVFSEGGKTGLLDSTGKVIFSAKHNYSKTHFDFDNQIIAVKFNDKWGYIDFQQNILLPLEYDHLREFSPLKFPLFQIGKKDHYQQTYYGLTFFNKNTKKFEEISPPIYTHIRYMEDSLLRLDKNDQRFFYRIPSRQLLNQQPFDKISPHNPPYANGTIVFNQSNRQGVIDSSGNILIPPQYRSVTPFHKGLSKVTLEEKNILIDSLGNVSDTISQLLYFSRNSPLKRFRKNGKEGLLNSTTGEIVLAAEYNKIQSQELGKYDCEFVCSNYLAHIHKDGKMGLVNMEGKEILKPIYTLIKEQSIGRGKFFLIKRGKDNKVGLVHKEGRFLLKPEYDKLQYFKLNQYLYRQNGKYGFVRFSDETIEHSIAEFNIPQEDMPPYIPPIFEDIHLSTPILAKQKGKWGILETFGVGTTGEMKIAARFDTFKVYKTASAFFIAVKKKRKWRLYNSSYQLIKEITCEQAPTLLDHHFGIVEKGKKSTIDFYGNVMPTEFEKIEYLNKKYSLFKQGNKWGIFTNGNITQKPEIVYPAEFEQASSSIYQKEWVSVKRAGIAELFYLKTGKIIPAQKGYFGPKKINERYIGFEKKRKWNIYDLEQEKMVAHTPYQEIKATQTDILVVRVGDKWGLFSLKTLKELVSPQFKGIHIEAQKITNQWIVTLQKEKSHYFGVIDHTGKFIIEPIVKQHFKQQENGNYHIFLNKEYLIIDSTGNIIDRKPFVKKLPNKNGFIPVKLNTTKWGFVNAKDSLVIPAIFDTVIFSPNSRFHNHCLFEVEKDGQTGTIDSLGKVLFPPMPYEKMHHFSSNCIRVKHKDKFGLIDSIGNILAPVRFEAIKDGREGTLAFYTNKWGCMDYSGNIIIDYQFITFNGFYDRFAKARGKDGIGIINQQGEFILPMEYSEVRHRGIKGKTVFIIFKNKRQGLADQQGNIILPPIYESLELHTVNRNPIFYQQGWIKCTLDGKTIYFNTKGETMLTSNYPETHLISTTSAVVKDTFTNKWGIQNLQSKKWLIAPIFDQYKSEGTPLKNLKIIPKMAYINRKGEYVWKEKEFELLELFTK